MTKQEFSALVANAGFTPVGDTLAYGFIGQHPLTLQFAAYGQLQLIFALEKNQISPFRRELKQALRKKGTFVINKLLVVTLRQNRNTPHPQSFAILANALNSFFSAHCIHPQDVCPYCKQSHCDSTAIVKNTYRGVHKRCVDEQLEGNLRATEKNELEGSYLTGVIGAILGGVVGCIPTILTLWFLERHFSLLYALIPLCIFYGYKLFRGRMNRAALVTTIILSVVYVFGLYVLYIGIVLVAYGYSLSFLRYFITDPEFLRTLTGDLAISLLFTALGVAIVWRRISQTNTTVISATQDVRDSIRPINRYAYAPAPQQVPPAQPYNEGPQ